VSLFAGLEEAADLNIPTCELLGDANDEFSDVEIQQFEKELMGIYVTSHPLSSIRDTLKYLTTDTVNEILETPQNEREVTLCGLLSKVAQKATKRDPSKFIKTGAIEDLAGKMEFVAFPKTVEALGSNLVEDQKVIMSAKVQVRDEEVNLIVQDIKPIQNINLVTFKMLRELAFEENVYLKELMAKHSGDDPVVIDFEDEDGTRRELLVGKRIWVNYSNDFHQEINRAFGDKLEIKVRELK
jgi:DNA polymerase-3 subunit alpha